MPLLWCNGRDHHHSKLITQLRIIVTRREYRLAMAPETDRGFSYRRIQENAFINFNASHTGQLSDYEIIAEYFRSLKQIEIVC